MSRQKIAGSTGVGVVVGVGVGVGVGVVVGVGVGLAVGLVVGLAVGLGEGGVFFEEDEHPAMARLTPRVSTRAAGRIRARLCLTPCEYRDFG
ncbi:MAG TPA: hypothetical protein VHX15_17860 [Frankiaceae bacterium]|nr:hypothetical protein [Frankiaceae bacterium]